VRDTREIFELIDDIKEIFENINFYISIYSDAGAEIRNIKFSEKNKMLVEYADRKIITNMKNSARPQFPNKRRKLIHL
jgi:hypothetical protein